MSREQKEGTGGSEGVNELNMFLQRTIIRSGAQRSRDIPPSFFTFLLFHFALGDNLVFFRIAHNSQSFHFLGSL